MPLASPAHTPLTPLHRDHNTMHDGTACTIMRTGHNVPPPAPWQILTLIGKHREQSALLAKFHHCTQRVATSAYKLHDVRMTQCAHEVRLRFEILFNDTLA
jgi:hypothetical protein